MRDPLAEWLLATVMEWSQEDVARERPILQAMAASFAGAIVATVLWEILQAIGGWYVARSLKGASQVYGFFAIVIGLLGWLYLGAQMTLLAAEINVVLRRKLWPRALVQPPLTLKDKEALRRLALMEERRPEEEIVVRFKES